MIVLLTSFLDVHGRGCDFSKGYCSLSSVCLAGNVDYSEMMTMINMAKEGLQDQLRKNDSVR